MSLPASLSLLVPLALAPAPEGGDYGQTITELRATIDNFTTADRSAAIRTLERLLDLVARYPDEVPRDHTVAEPVLRGWIVLAGLHLAEGDEQAASAAMDAAIRRGRDQALPVRDYGPKVYQLYEERVAALRGAGTSTILVRCEVDCEVVIDGRALPKRSEERLLGTSAVWIRASEGHAQWEYREVELTRPDKVEIIEFADPAPPMAIVDGAERAPKPKRRMVPRSAAIAGVTVGLGLVIAGAVLLSFNGKCSQTNERPSATISPEECGSIYRSTLSGYSLLGVGGGALMVSSVLLSVDEVRVGRERGRQVMVGVSLKF